MKLLLAVATIVALTSLCMAAYDPRSTNSQDGEQWWTDWNYSIDKGQCTGRKVASEEVTKSGEPYTVKKTIYSWDGQQMYRITCVRVLNGMYQDRRAGKARIVKGGTGHSEVKIEMSSQISEPFHFNVEIWGEPLQGSGRNLAIMTDPTSRTMYYGGQKYCACS